MKLKIPVKQEIQMKYRKLGNSELHVSEISLGSWGIHEGVEQQNAGFSSKICYKYF